MNTVSIALHRYDDNDADGDTAADAAECDAYNDDVPTDLGESVDIC
jgi:hypothetical protein